MVLTKKVIHEDLLYFKIFINFINFYCLKFSAKNFAIPRDENMLQGKIVSIPPD